MRFFKSLVNGLLLICSCSSLQLRFINKESSSNVINQIKDFNINLIPNIVRDEKSISIFEKKETNTKPASQITNLVWDKFSLMGIKLQGTITFVPNHILDKGSTLEGIQKKFGKTKVIIPKDHHDGKNICYKDNNKNIIVKFYEDFFGGPDLGAYKVSKEKDVSIFKECLSKNLENIETKSGLKIGMNRKEVENLFYMEPFKSAKKFNSIKEANNYEFSKKMFLTTKTVNNKEILYYLISDWWREKCLVYELINHRFRKKYPKEYQICNWQIVLTIKIHFKLDKVSSFKIEAYRGS